MRLELKPQTPFPLYNEGCPFHAPNRCNFIRSSRECQTAHWHAGHKKQAKREKLAYTKYCYEKETNTPDPNRFNHDGGFLPIKKYQEGRLRFRVGDFVECLVGEDTYATGRIVKLMYQEPSMARAAPYQVKLDRESADRLGVPFQHALIYSDWDDDLKVRKLPGQKSLGKKGAAKRGKKGRGRR